LDHPAQGAAKRNAGKSSEIKPQQKLCEKCGLASYSQPVRQRLCLVPVRGWHEWPDRNTPFYIHRADDQPLVPAGIWDTWESRDPADQDAGSLVTSMSIITTPPVAYMAKSHDRSPLVLEGARALAWVRPDQSEDQMRALMQPYDSPRLEVCRVATAVNRATNKDATVRDAIAPPVPHGDVPVATDEETLPLGLD
jgi:putative SOS response-associated peptidase YedK